MLGFKKTYLLPFRFDIPNYTQEFLQKESILKRWIKFIKRKVFIALKGQKSLEITNILPEHKNILWINISAPSLGDSLMDLSSRVMLKNRKLDLFTDKGNASLYQNDSAFSSVFTQKKEVDKNSYDLVIIDSYSSRSVAIKATIAPLTPFIGMFGYFNGPEVNRVLFSFHRMNHLLGYQKNQHEINKIAKCFLSISADDLKIIQKIKLPSCYIAIAIGGEWDYRNYRNWNKVIKKLLNQNSNLNIVLVGSENAKDDAKVISDKFSKLNIFNCVSKFTFNQTAQIINQAEILLCCDGGLMHSANAVNTVTVSLFARLERDMQLTETNCVFTLFDKRDVNNISVQDIVQKYNEASNFVDIRLRVE